MNKEFVTYEQALALKELGFDEPCLKMGMSDIDIINTERTDEGDYPKNSHLFSGWVAIPTYSAAFRWFREKHGLQGYIYSTTVRGKKDGDRHFSDYCWNINGIDMPFMKTDARDMERVTYEEAEQACLNKLIEIVKNNAHI